MAIQVGMAAAGAGIGKGLQKLARSKSFRDRPRSNNDSRVKYPSVQTGRPKSEPFRPSDYEALKLELQAYKAGKNGAGEALGLKAAERYMEGPDVGARQVYRQQTKNGNFDLDRVYKKGDTYYVVEAKGPNAKPTGREVPGQFQPNGEPWHAMEGSEQYLRDTIRAMEKSGNPASMRFAREELGPALDAGKVEYIQVKARPRSNNPNEFYFSVTVYKLSNKP